MPELRPVVVQDARDGRVLMLGYADDEALRRTLRDGYAWFYSRSRGRLWRKGEQSGHGFRVREVLVDCDGDALLYRGVPEGPICHTGQPTCFFRPVAAPGADRGGLIAGAAPGSPAPAAAAAAAAPAAAEPGAAAGVLETLAAVIGERAARRPEGSYTAALLSAGPAQAARKVGEEATETVIAALSEDPLRLVAEAADLVYHVLVLLEAAGPGAGALGRELARRMEAGR